MYKAQDGKSFGNNEQGKHYDKSRPKPHKPASEHEQNVGTEHPPDQDIQSVVAEHGPAENVEIHSHHPDGHVHKATHHDPHTGAAHVHHAFGSTPPAEHGEPVSDEMGAGAASIPGMRG